MIRKYLVATIALASAISLWPAKAFAHCPLCTGGAGAAAALAAFFGVKYGAIAVFMGAFATALSLWIARKIKKQYVRYQSQILFWILYISTLAPMYPFMKGDYVSKYVSFGGEFGSWSNKTYLLDLFFVGAVVGTIIMFVSPYLSKAITKRRGGKTIRFQGLAITFVLLIVSAVLMQLWPR